MAEMHVLDLDQLRRRLEELRRRRGLAQPLPEANTHTKSEPSRPFSTFDPDAPAEYLPDEMVVP